MVGDVAGKGVAAALLMAKLSAEVRFCFLTEPDPAKAMTLLNDALIRGGIGDRFVAFAAAIVDPEKHTVTLMCAGLENPLRCRGGVLSEAITNAEGGFPLGLVPGNEYRIKTLPLEPGDTVMVFSDGVSDAGGSDNPFGRAGLTKACVCEDVCDGGSVREIGERVVKALKEHAGGKPQFDDIALVCVGRSEKRVAASGPPTTSRLNGPVFNVPDSVSGSALRRALES